MPGSSFVRKQKAAGSSSFSRNEAPSRKIPRGCRPGPHGQPVTSTGLETLDQALGGGLPLGTLLLVLEDSFAPHHLVLLRYFLAQGFAHGSSALLVSNLPSPATFLSTLPAVSVPSNQHNKPSQPDLSASRTAAGSIGSSPNQSARPDAEADGLRIAFQYRRFIAEQDALRERREQGRDEAFCTPFDFRKTVDRPTFLSMQRAATTFSFASLLSPASSSSSSSSSSMSSSSRAASSAAAPLPSSYSPSSSQCIPDISPSSHSSSDPMPSQTPSSLPSRAPPSPPSSSLLFKGLHFRCLEFFDRVAAQQRIEDGGTVQEASVGRVAIQSLGAPPLAFETKEELSLLLSFLFWLKGQLRSSHCVALVSLPSSLLPASCLSRFLRIADVVLQAKALEENNKTMESMISDFNSSIGLLQIQKAPNFGSLVPLYMDNTFLAMKVLKRKQLVVEKLHPPPIDAGSEGAKSTACNTKEPKLDF